MPEVYDYVYGKADWRAAGMPTVGTLRNPPRAIDVMERAVPTCTTEESVAGAAERTRAAGWKWCVVLNDHEVVQGRLRLDRLTTEAGQVQEVMEPGPATVRADADVAETTQRMKSKGVSELIVSTPDGVLLGVLRASAG